MGDRDPAKTATYQATYHAAYQAAHKVELAAYRAAYYAAHKAELAAQTAAYREAHKEERAVQKAAYTRANPDTVRARKQKRRTAVAGGGGSYSAAEWAALVEFHGGRCLCCGRDDLKLTADHIVPVARGGSSNIGNIQPLCQSCNSSKGTKSTDYR